MFELLIRIASHLLIAFITAFVVVLTILFLGIQKKKRDLAKLPQLDLDGVEFRTELKKMEKNLYQQVGSKEGVIDKVEEKLGNNPVNYTSVKSFGCVSKNTQCLFAKKAKMWGSPEWDDSKSIEENVKASCQPFELFVEIGKPLHLDGFVIQIKGKEYGDTIEHFGQTVRRVLTALSDNDPHKSNCMRKSYVGKRGWTFEYANEHLFCHYIRKLLPIDSLQIHVQW